MQMFFMRVAVPTFVAFLAACEQKPAHVEDKGRKSYAKNSESFVERTTDEAASGYNVVLSTEKTSTKSSIQSIESSDLPELPASKKEKPQVMNGGFKMPVDGRIIKNFGEDSEGITIAADEGTPVYASAEGKVVFTGSQIKSYGNMAIIKHENKKNTSYSHLSKIAVSKGQQVSQGELIGYVGKTGNAKQPQLHFALRDGAKPINPISYLPSNIAMASN